MDLFTPDATSDVIADLSASEILKCPVWKDDHGAGLRAMLSTLH